MPQPNPAVRRFEGRPDPPARGIQAAGRLALLLALLAGLTACGGGVAPVASIQSESAAASPEPTLEPVQDTAAVEPTDTPSASPHSSPPEATATAAPTPRPGAVTELPVLMYHYIRELPPNTRDQLGYGLSIAPKLFDQQLAYLAAAHYDTVAMGDVASHIIRGTPLPPKPIVLSFDDGYADFYTAAWPLLKKYHLGATVYLVVDFLGKPGYMSWQQAQELRDAGIDIGAHTLDHVDLAIQPLPIARRQIADSRRILQQRLNAPVNSFAYPSGRYTPVTVRIVADAGFAAAVTTSFGARQTAANILTMPRVRVPGGISMQNFVKNLTAA